MTTTLAPSPARTYTSLRAAWVPLAALCLAFFVEMVDNTLLTIALPTIGRDLGGSTTTLQWITGAYSLTFGGLLLTAGSVADRLGRRRVLLVGLAAFGLISLAVLAVSTGGELIALRASLGLAAALTAPITNSLVFRLFEDPALRRRAMTVMIVVGMSGFILGPVLGGTALAHLPWQWLLLINAPLALLAVLGVLRGVPADRPEDLTRDRLDLPGALLSMLAIGLGCFTLTSGVEHGWTSALTLGCAIGALAALAAFLVHERRTASPMLDLSLLGRPTIRGAALAQMGSSLAMAGIMFGLILHFQYANGWSPLVAGLANLPMILTMIGATPVSEALLSRLGHRMACLVGAGLLALGLAGMALAVSHGYLAIAAAMIVLTLGMRTVMTICAVALVEAMPENRTSLGAALNDTAQELGTSIGTALVGTLIAVLVASVLPAGTWDTALVTLFHHGEAITYGALAVVVGLLAGWGALTLTDSRTAEAH
ncbi:MFS transporter [Brachybacterium sp. NBEC-018]|uniref:MFS transporter n=1 Tax=Brachybacterium sp. NBEC-018 TaxID=2996004 RepID=UPI0021753EB1|nr:MFS transporter [Brachybacterium sp. NBEC-018]UVY82505.1 MFS transporter [Brachybacterium sp. NBEC-018]